MWAVSWQAAFGIHLLVIVDLKCSARHFHGSFVRPNSEMENAETPLNTLTQHAEGEQTRKRRKKINPTDQENRHEE